jgi:transcriptional regulator with XRE-family HTH domain
MIGHKIRTLRELHKIDPKVLADRLDIDLSTLNRIENNKIRTFKPDFLLKLAEELHSNIAELFDQASNIAIQNNEQGQNVNVLNQHLQAETREKQSETEILLKEIIKSKDETNRSQDYLIGLLRNQLEELQNKQV